MRAPFFLMVFAFLSTCIGCSSYQQVKMDPADPTLSFAIAENRVKDSRALVHLKTGETLNAVIGDVKPGYVEVFYSEDHPSADPLSEGIKSMVRKRFSKLEIASLDLELKTVGNSGSQGAEDSTIDATIGENTDHQFFGIRGSAGGGYPGGQALGAGLTYTTVRGGHGWELGLSIMDGRFKRNYESSWPNPDGTWNEFKMEHEVTSFGAFANFLLGRLAEDGSGHYSLLGGGVAQVSGYSEETMSVYHPHIGNGGVTIPDPDATLTWEGDGLGYFLNLGRGIRTSSNVDARIQLSGHFYGNAGGLPTVLPVLMVSMGFRF